MFLQTVIKELNLKFKIKENPNGIKRETIVLQYCTIMTKNSGNEKTRYTVVLACCVDGTKLPPLLIFKRKTLLKGVIPHGIYVHVHSKGWMDGEGM